MPTNLLWKQRRNNRLGNRHALRDATPLRALAANLAPGLAQLARAAFAEPFVLTVERHAVMLPRLPRTLDGLRIVQLTDLHHSPFTGSGQLQQAIETANSLQPDIIALTGDYVSHEREYAAPCAELVGRLRAKHGIFAVLGNHDHWTDAY